MSDAPDPSLTEQLRREAYDEIGRVAFMAEDYAQKLYAATELQDVMGVAGRLQQLRFCAMAAIQTFNLVLRKAPFDGQGMAEGKPENDHREDQRSGDAVA